MKEIMLRDGFADPPSSLETGASLRLTKRISSELEMHVRGLDDPTLGSEVGLSREYLEHPFDCRSLCRPLLEIPNTL